MIVKKIPARRDSRQGGSGRARHVRNLVDYMRTPDKETEDRDYLVAYMASQGLDHGPERLIHIGARNFVCEGLDEQRAEMMAVAQAAVRSNNPIDHWLLSWREGEMPTNEEVDEAVRMFAEELGVADRQCIYAVHGDTHNRHAHIALNRFDPASGKVVTINKGFYKEAAHKAVARIVDRFGWEPEAEARYVMVDGIPVLSAAAKAKVEKGLRPLLAGASAYEVRTGYRSAQRIAQEEAAPILLGSKGWKELHSALAARGMTYDPVGTNGAVVSVAGEKVTASNVHRHATMTWLQRRLGAFEARDPNLVIAERPGAADRFPEAFRADEYRRQCEEWRSASPEQRKNLKLSPPAPDLETFLNRANEQWAAKGWRKRELDWKAMNAVDGVPHPAATGLPQEIDGFRAYRCGEGVRYARDGEGTSIVATGSRIALVVNSDDAILAAVRLGAGAAANTGAPGHGAGIKGLGWRDSESVLGGGRLIGMDEDVTDGGSAASGSMQAVGPQKTSTDDPSQPHHQLRLSGSGTFKQRALEIAHRNGLQHHFSGGNATRVSAMAVKAEAGTNLTPDKDRSPGRGGTLRDQMEEARRAMEAKGKQSDRAAARAAMSQVSRGPDALVRNTAPNAQRNVEGDGDLTPVPGSRNPPRRQLASIVPTSRQAGNDVVPKADGNADKAQREADEAKRAGGAAALRDLSKGPTDQSQPPTRPSGLGR